MCLFDNKLGRQKEVVKGQSFSSSGGPMGKVASRDPNRTAVLVTLTPTNTSDNSAAVIIRSDSQNGAVVGIASLYHPFLELTVERHGQAVTGDLYANGASINDEDVDITLIRLNEELPEK